MPLALGHPEAHDGRVFRRVEGILCLMPRCTAEDAGSDNVYLDVLTTVAFRLKMLCRALKPLRQAWRNRILREELCRPGVPHWQCLGKREGYLD